MTSTPEQFLAAFERLHLETSDSQFADGSPAAATACSAALLLGPKAVRKGRTTEDSEALRQLMVQASFRDAKIRDRTRTARLPDVADFVLQHLAATPVAGAVEALSNSVRRALAEDVRTALRPYADGDGIAFPDAANVVIGVR